MAVQKSEGFVEFKGEVQAAETLARSLGKNVQRIMQSAKNDRVSSIRLVGRDEYKGRLAAEFSALANSLNILGKTK